MAYRGRDYDDIGARRRQMRELREKRYKKKMRITLILLLLIFVAVVVACVLFFGKDENNGRKQDAVSTSQPTTAQISTEEQTSTGDTAVATENSATSTAAVKQETVPATSTQPKTKAANAEPSDKGSYDDGIKVSFNKAETSKWYLKFINPWSDPLPQNYAPDLSVVQDYKVHSGIVKPLRAMISAAADDGVNLYIISGYRSYQRQKTNFDNRVQQYINQGMTRAQAEKKTATIIAVPGTSEHHLGLACDFNSLDQNFEYTKAGKWLNNNAYKYGFILRYAKNTTDITGIIYEPWHFRYVSVGHAKKIQEMGVTLEEYIKWLNSQG